MVRVFSNTLGSLRKNSSWKRRGTVNSQSGSPVFNFTLSCFPCDRTGVTLNRTRDQYVISNADDAHRIGTGHEM